MFAGTVANWGDERARDRFFRRLAGSAEFRRPERSWESQRAELAALETRYSAASPVPPNPFRSAWIGGRDRIIPAESQRRFWRARPETAVTEHPDAPHLPFAIIRSFREVADAGRNR
ncbi:hypothetical protein SDC9_212816 [bioreactor metagenome]|uniref:AB hydrolase-1 domain-containing protein n=1 Tax=bioreactor metagenome TaxID=1076179 RepID=A0A645JNX3_9ZZZZ